MGENQNTILAICEVMQGAAARALAGRGADRGAVCPQL